MKFEVHIDRDGEQPVYLQIRDQLKSQIKAKGLQSGTRMPSVDLVAEFSNCSLRTADLAMKALVEDGTCYRRPKKGTFIAPQKNTAVRNICGVWSKLNRQDVSRNLVAAHLVRGVQETTAGTSLDVTLLTEDPEETIGFYRTMEAFDFRGLLVVDRENFPRTLELARLFPEIKFVLLNYHIRLPEDCPENVVLIMNNDRLGARLLAEHYISQGVRKFAVVMRELHPDDLTYRERLSGFAETAAAHSCSFDPEKDIVASSSKTEKDIRNGGYLAAKRYLENGSRPEVIFTVNDYLACGIQQYLREEKLEGRIRVAGYDMLNPDLVFNCGFDTVAVDYAAMSRLGIELLRGQASVPTRTIMIDPKLYIAK
ncbi:MAG: substrate-binding domain-containing protein [Lentisphaeria bacterium]|nr:substrate-binding domain-containing protein [Lentisphaeria bacterium]